jgi:hypothetical protein
MIMPAILPAVSYYGTILMTRSDAVMTSLPDIGAIGFRHQRLRELGGGWQVLETSGRDDPPNLALAVGAAAGRWQAPVLGLPLEAPGTRARR